MLNQLTVPPIPSSLEGILELNDAEVDAMVARHVSKLLVRQGEEGMEVRLPGPGRGGNGWIPVPRFSRSLDTIDRVEEAVVKKHGAGKYWDALMRVMGLNKKTPTMIRARARERALACLVVTGEVAR